MGRKNRFFSFSPSLTLFFFLLLFFSVESRISPDPRFGILNNYYFESESMYVTAAPLARGKRGATSVIVAQIRRPSLRQCCTTSCTSPARSLFLSFSLTCLYCVKSNNGIIRLELIAMCIEKIGYLQFKYNYSKHKFNIPRRLLLVHE